MFLQDSQISFSGEENNNAAATPKKPTTTSSPEAAKLKELGRSVQTQADSKSKKKQLSNSKTKAITGRDIFASPPPPETQVAATKQQVKGNKNLEESAKASNVSTKFVIFFLHCDGYRLTIASLFNML